MSGTSTLLIIVIIVVVICIIYYFYTLNKKPIKNDGSIKGLEKRGNTSNDTDAQEVLDRYSAERGYEESAVDYSPFNDKSESSSEETVKNGKRKYIRRSQKDIMKDFDVQSLLPDPKQKRDDWFETFHQQPTEKISGTQLIHPKDLAGYSELREPLRNRSRDPRGDVFVPKVDNYPWGNSVIVADRGNKGYCG
jgi:hypothetical protein